MFKNDMVLIINNNEYDINNFPKFSEAFCKMSRKYMDNA